MKELHNQRFDGKDDPITTRDVIENILVIAGIFIIGYFMIVVASILDNPVTH